MPHGSASLPAYFAQPLNPGPTAELYSSLAAVLAGFAFTGLMLFLNAQFKIDSRSGEIKPRTVVATLFYAMSSLTICAFLYGRAAGESVPTGRTYLMLALYGVVLAPAVLSLFYALNLVMVGHATTAEAAVHTRWVVAAVGPAVVMSLLADLLAHGWAFGCKGGCPAWTSPRLWGFGLAACFLVFGLMTSLLAAQRNAERSRREAEDTRQDTERPRLMTVLSSWLKRLVDLVLWFNDREPVKACAEYFRGHKSAPAFITLILTSVVAIFSLWARGIPDGFGTRAWTHVLLGFAALVMGVFAFAAASVLDEPVYRGFAPVRSAAPDSDERDDGGDAPKPRLG